MVGGQAEESTYPVSPTQQHKKKRKSQFQDVSMSSPVTVGRELRSQLWHSCDTCGKTNQGPCRWRQDGCYKCGQLGHYLKDCP